MILAAGRNGCAREVLIITAALAIQDPRERPADARDAADAMHRRFAEPGSDFLAFLTLWEYLREQQRELSSSAFRRLCRREYLHFLRDPRVAGRVRPAAAGGQGRRRRHRPGPGQPGPGSRDRGSQDRGSQNGKRDTPAENRYSADLADRVHQSLLAGLLSHIGMQDADRKAADRKPGDRSAAGSGPPPRPGRVPRCPRRQVRDLP